MAAFTEPLLRRVLARTEDAARRRELRVLLGEEAPKRAPAASTAKDG